MEKLNYLTVTKSDFTFAVSVLGQFLSAPRTTYLEAVMRILRYLKKAKGRELFYTDHKHTIVKAQQKASQIQTGQGTLLIGGQLQDLYFFRGNLVS